MIKIISYLIKLPFAIFFGVLLPFTFKFILLVLKWILLSPMFFMYFIFWIYKEGAKEYWKDSQPGGYWDQWSKGGYGFGNLFRDLFVGLAIVSAVNRAGDARKKADYEWRGNTLHKKKKY